MIGATHCCTLITVELPWVRKSHIDAKPPPRGEEEKCGDVDTWLVGGVCAARHKAHVATSFYSFLCLRWIREH